MNKTTLLVPTCALFLAFAGLQGFAQSSADPTSSQAGSMNVSAEVLKSQQTPPATEFMQR
jgi:hypothetical protein